MANTCKSGEHNSRKAMRGFTLVELLIVIVILTTLVATVLPSLTPSTEDRRLREGARQFKNFLQQQQVLALETGRPHGVWLQTRAEPIAITDLLNSKPMPSYDSSDILSVSTIFACEVPPAFTGFQEAAGAAISLTSSTGSPIKAVQAGNQATVIFGYTNPNTGAFVPDQLPPGVIRPGDLLQIRGWVLRIDGLSNGTPPDDAGYLLKTTSISCRVLNSTRGRMNHSFSPDTSLFMTLPNPMAKFTQPTAYKIIRQPQRTSEAPLELPNGVVLDLQASARGENFDDFLGGGLSPIILLFSPDGSLRTIHINSANAGAGPDLGYSQVQPEPVQGMVSFLIGKYEDVDVTTTAADPTETLKSNWLKPNALWVSVLPSSGYVRTDDNNMPSQVTLDEIAAGTKDAMSFRQSARSFATTATTKGSR